MAALTAFREGKDGHNQRPDGTSRFALTNSCIVYILRPDPSLWSLLGAHAAPLQLLLVHTIIGAVHLLQQAPELIMTKSGTTKGAPCARYFGQPGDVTAAVTGKRK